MKGQLYRVELTDDAAMNAKPAQFVFPANYDDTVIGFVNDVDIDNRESELCLFSPSNLPEGARCVQETLSEAVFIEMLRIALDKNPEMKEEWGSVIEDTTADRHTVH